MDRRAATIRTAEPADAPDIAGVARRTWPVTYAGIIPDDVQRRLLETWYSPPALTRAIGAGVFLVAERTGAVVGFVQLVRRSPESAELTRIYVLPEHQRAGVGTELLEAGIAACRTQGLGRVTVFVEQDNPVGRGFYRRRGFTELGARRRDVEGYSLALVECHRTI
jgi:ribosomal protein S18 acetylase RimI-like enzyme